MRHGNHHPAVYGPAGVLYWHHRKVVQRKLMLQATGVAWKGGVEYITAMQSQADQS